MSLSTIREQVRAQMRGEKPTLESLKNLTESERSAVRAMQRRMANAATESDSSPTVSWWI
jgi:hypothetical protein